jgi:hypothetical protein
VLVGAGDDADNLVDRIVAGQRRQQRRLPARQRMESPDQQSQHARIVHAKPAPGVPQAAIGVACCVVAAGATAGVAGMMAVSSHQTAFSTALA